VPTKHRRAPDLFEFAAAAVQRSLLKNSRKSSTNRPGPPLRRSGRRG
jgi:hypothetical protein